MPNWRGVNASRHPLFLESTIFVPIAGGRTAVSGTYLASIGRNGSVQGVILGLSTSFFVTQVHCSFPVFGLSNWHPCPSALQRYSVHCLNGSLLHSSHFSPFKGGSQGRHWKFISCFFSCLYITRNTTAAIASPPKNPNCPALNGPRPAPD